MIDLLVAVLVLALIFGLAYWVLGMIPLPEPFGMVARVALGIIMLLILLGLLFGGVNLPQLRLR